MNKMSNLSNEELLELAKNSSSMTELARQLGYVKSGAIFNTIRTEFAERGLELVLAKSKPSPIKRTSENVFIENSTADQKTLRKFYVNGEYTEYKCSICGQEPIWCGKEMSLILDHINGHNHDDRLENLRWVCPNCNSQLSTTGARNIKK